MQQQLSQRASQAKPYGHHHRPAKPIVHARRPAAQRTATIAAAAAPPTAPTKAVPAHAPPHAGAGHSALLHGLGDVGDVSPQHMPWLLRLAHVLGQAEGRDSAQALSESARGLMGWRECLNR